MKNQQAFTLVELVVVIVIVATLACIAIPVGSGIGEKGMAAQDLSHMRQLGIGTNAYLTDHNGRIFSSETQGGWPSALYSKYVTNWNPFKSPFDKRPSGVASTTGAGVPVSYGINGNILAQSADDANAFDGKVAEYSSPSLLIYMAPNVDFTQTTLTFNSGTGDSNVAVHVPKKPPMTYGGDRGTHSGRSQIDVLFADYHVASIGYQDFASSSDANGQARWRPIQTP